MCSQGSTWDHLGFRKAPVEAAPACTGPWSHSRNADHRDGQSVPNRDGVINVKQHSTHSWEEKKNGLTVIALFKHPGLDFGLCLGCNAL